MVTADLAKSNGSLPPGLWLMSPLGCLPRTEISPGTLRSVIEYYRSTFSYSCTYWHSHTCSADTNYRYLVSVHFTAMTLKFMLTLFCMHSVAERTSLCSAAPLGCKRGTARICCWAPCCCPVLSQSGCLRPGCVTVAAPMLQSINQSINQGFLIVA